MRLLSYTLFIFCLVCFSVEGAERVTMGSLYEEMKNGKLKDYSEMVVKAIELGEEDLFRELIEKPIQINSQKVRQALVDVGSVEMVKAFMESREPVIQGYAEYGDIEFFKQDKMPNIEVLKWLNRFGDYNGNIMNRISSCGKITQDRYEELIKVVGNHVEKLLNKEYIDWDKDFLFKLHKMGKIGVVDLFRKSRWALSWKELEPMVLEEMAKGKKFNVEDVTLLVSASGGHSLEEKMKFFEERGYKLTAASFNAIEKNGCISFEVLDYLMKHFEEEGLSYAIRANNYEMFKRGIGRNVEKLNEVVKQGEGQVMLLLNNYEKEYGVEVDEVVFKKGLDGLLNGDKIHFDTTSHMELLARRYGDSLDSLPEETAVKLLEKAAKGGSQSLWEKVEKVVSKDVLNKKIEDNFDRIFLMNVFNLEELEQLRDEGMKVRGHDALSSSLLELKVVKEQHLLSPYDEATYAKILNESTRKCDVLVEMGQPEMSKGVGFKEFLLANFNKDALEYLQSKGADVVAHLDWIIDAMKLYILDGFSEKGVMEFLDALKYLREEKYEQLIKSKRGLSYLIAAGLRDLVGLDVTQEAKDEALKHMVMKQNYAMMKVLLDGGAKIEEREVIKVVRGMKLSDMEYLLKHLKGAVNEQFRQKLISYVEKADRRGLWREYLLGNGKMLIGLSNSHGEWSGPFDDLMKGLGVHREVEVIAIDGTVVFDNELMGLFSGFVNPGGGDNYPRHGDAFDKEEMDAGARWEDMDKVYQGVLNYAKLHHVPYVGMCAGFQHLVLNSGGKLRAVTGFLDEVDVTIHKGTVPHYMSYNQKEKKDLFTKCEHSEDLLIKEAEVAHSFAGVKGELGGNMTLGALARGDVPQSGSFSMFQVGFQFHPEYQYADAMKGVNECLPEDEKTFRQRALLESFIFNAMSYSRMLKYGMKRGLSRNEIEEGMRVVGWMQEKKLGECLKAKPDQEQASEYFWGGFGDLEYKMKEGSGDDVLVILPGIVKEDMQIWREGDNLIFHNKHLGEFLKIEDHYKEGYGVERVLYSDGVEEIFKD